jgi:AcrR family transcriptional regulator
MPPRATRARQDPPERLEELVDVAARLFRDRGYDATSMQDIAEEFGTLKSTLYHYVTTKEDLLWAIVAQPFNDLVDDAAALFADRSVPLTERIRGAITAHCESFARHYPHMVVATRENGETLSPDRRAELMGLRDRYAGLWKQAITAGKRSGEIRADVDVGIAVQAVLGMINWMFRWFHPDGGMSPAKIGDQFATIFVSGIAG